MHVQVVIVGGGPAGLLLASKLAARNVEVLVLEQRTRQYVLSRIRAGVLETGTVNQLVEIGLGKRLLQEGLTHHGVYLSNGSDLFRIDFEKLTGKWVTVYGQTEVTRDLYKALDQNEVHVLHEAKVQSIQGHEGQKPRVHFEHADQIQTVSCEFVVGCDGFHGVSNRTIRANRSPLNHIQLPFGWLGILSETPPVREELIYSRSSRGFALASMRSHALSRYYIQVPVEDNVDSWSDERFWNELKLRLPSAVSDTLTTGDSIEKSLAPLRAYVANTMRDGRLLLCGDAAHIVPPTGAKGLNLAVSDVFYVHGALMRYYEDNDWQAIEEYSRKALTRVWKTMRFSWWMTTMLHPTSSQSDFDEKIMASELAHLQDSKHMQAVFSENYTGLPYS